MLLPGFLSELINVDSVIFIVAYGREMGSGSS